MKIKDRVAVVAIFFILYLVLDESIIQNIFKNYVIDDFSNKAKITFQIIYSLAKNVILGFSVYNLVFILYIGFVSQRNSAEMNSSPNNLRDDNSSLKEEKTDDIKSQDNNLFSSLKPLLKLNLSIFIFIGLLFFLFNSLGHPVDTNSLKSYYQGRLREIIPIHSEPIYSEYNSLLDNTSTQSAKSRYKSVNVEDFFQENTDIDFSPLDISYTEELASYLHITKEIQAERELLILWSKQERGYSQYLDYLKKNYFDRCGYFLNSMQFNRLNWYSKNFLMKIYYRDTSFKENNNELDAMVIKSLVFVDKDIVYASEEELSWILEKIDTFFSDSADSDDPNISKELTHKNIREISNYLEGVKLFRYSRFKEAIAIFTDISNSTENVFLKNYSKLLLARCIFWNIDGDEIKKNSSRIRAIIRLKRISEEMNIVPLKTDVDEYRLILEDYKSSAK